jgi:hypothetical protein
VLSPARPGLLVTVIRVMRSIIANLTPAIGASGPHVYNFEDGERRWKQQNPLK